MEKSGAVRVLAFLLAIVLVTDGNVTPVIDDVSGIEGQVERFAQAAEQTEKIGGGLSNVAGAATPLLQANSTLTHDDVESRLKAAATKDSFTGDPPEANTWGSGKLNIYDALRRGDLIRWGTSGLTLA
ncbi:MAG: hypothetical protein HYY29_04620 [Chloroflexi bacterium]|nr:hypothetical protein [Chloroflexota bacterium]